MRSLIYTKCSRFGETELSEEVLLLQGSTKNAEQCHHSTQKAQSSLRCSCQEEIRYSQRARNNTTQIMLEA